MALITAPSIGIACCQIKIKTNFWKQISSQIINHFTSGTNKLAFIFISQKNPNRILVISIFLLSLNKFFQLWCDFYNFSKGKTRMYTHSLPHQADDDWSSHAFVGGDEYEIFKAENCVKQPHSQHTVNVGEK